MEGDRKEKKGKKRETKGGVSESPFGTIILFQYNC